MTNLGTVPVAQVMRAEQIVFWVIGLGLVGRHLSSEPLLMRS